MKTQQRLMIRTLSGGIRVGSGNGPRIMKIMVMNEAKEHHRCYHPPDDEPCYVDVLLVLVICGVMSHYHGTGESSGNNHRRTHDGGDKAKFTYHRLLYGDGGMSSCAPHGLRLGNDRT